MLSSLTDALSGAWWTYPLVLAICAGDAVVPILPGETSLIVAGVLSSQGILSLPLVIAAGAIGAFLGDSTSFLLGRRAGAWTRRRLFSGARGKRSLAWAERQLDTRGATIIVVARFVPGGRTAASFMAGSVDYGYRRFAPAAIAGGLLWSVYSTLLGRIGGAAFEDNALAALGVAALLAVGAAVLIEGSRKLLARRRRVSP